MTGNPDDQSALKGKLAKLWHFTIEVYGPGATDRTPLGVIHDPRQDIQDCPLVSLAFIFPVLVLVVSLSLSTFVLPDFSPNIFPFGILDNLIAG